MHGTTRLALIKAQRSIQDREARQIRKHAAKIAEIADELWGLGDGEGGLVYIIIQEELEKAGHKVNPYAFVAASDIREARQEKS